MTRLIVLGFLIGLCTSICAQDYTTAETASKKLQKRYEKARDKTRSGNYTDALKELNRILEEDPTFIDAHIRLAQIKYDQRALPEAEQAYEQSLSIDAEYRHRTYYELALTEMRQDKFAEAATHFEAFLEREERNDRTINRAESYLANARFAANAVQNPVPFEPKKIPGAVNTELNEFLPTLTADESMLVFSRLVGDQEDIFYSKKENDQWGAGQPIEGLNTPFNEASQTISADGHILVFTACERPDAINRSCDLFLMEFSGSRWTAPTNIGAPVNTGDWESMPSISADGRTLFFASKRNGGQGGEDLWVANRKTDGTWNNPQNLGTTINTAGDERSPFMHPDGQTLYFMSNGHPGMGGFDLYYSRKQADGTWSMPVNLGFPINTQMDEGAIFVSLDGRTAYFNSNRIDEQSKTSGYADSDIYTFELYPEARPLPVTYVKAKVRDKNTQKSLAAQVSFTDLEKDELFASAITDQRGEFLVCLPAGKDYALNVSVDGYLFHSEHFALSGSATLEQPFLLEIELIPIPQMLESDSTIAEKVQPVVLKNVFFETGSAALKKTSITELTRLYQLLKDHPQLKIRINGHTDNVGNETDNLKLSEDRAKAVYDFLIEKGVDKNRLQYKGFGESQPIANNETEEGKRRNRRTEFEIIE